MQNLTELEWLALCVYDEARNQCFAGQRAVATVVINRMVLKYSSDRTIKGTVLAKDQFSGFYFENVTQANGQLKYTRVCATPAEAEARQMKRMLPKGNAWDIAKAAAFIEMSLAGAVQGMPPVLPRDAVLYANLAVVKRPVWATPANQVAVIQDHTFFRAAPQ